MKTLVIINGVTGAIGTACLAEFARNSNVDIYGLSRKALPFQSFLDNGKLATNTLMCSIGNIKDPAACHAFTRSIDTSVYGRVIYIHAVGVYPFEVNHKGVLEVSNDHDGDGIDDRVVELSYNAFFTMVHALGSVNIPVHAVIFGGVADEFEPAVHRSWWSVMKKVRERMIREAETKTSPSFSLLNISSVICPHELLTRPFVFQKTNAHPRFWLVPSEVAQKVANMTLETGKGFTETALFHKSNYYEPDYFAEYKFTDRKRKELGITA